MVVSLCLLSNGSMKITSLMKLAQSTELEDMIMAMVALTPLSVNNANLLSPAMCQTLTTLIQYPSLVELLEKKP